MSVGFYPARDYQPLVEFGAIRRGGSKSCILTDEQVASLAHCLPAIRDSICVGGDRVIIKCVCQLSTTHAKVARVGQTVCRHGVQSLTLADMD